MADEVRKPRRLKDLVEESPFWDAEFLIRNLDAEIDRLEQGAGHLVWSIEGKPVTRCLRPLPMTPKFEVKEDSEKFGVSVALPGVPEDNIRLEVDKRGIEVFACSDEVLCRPYYLQVESRVQLDPDSTRIRRTGSTLEVEVEKVRKKVVKIR